MANEVMKVHPQIIHNLDTKGLNVLERRVFKVLSWMLRDAGSAVVTITFKDFANLMQQEGQYSEPARFVSTIEKTYSKIISTTFRYEDEEKITVFNVFHGFEVDKRKETISIGVLPPFSSLFTKLEEYVYYELIEYQGLSSGYAQLMYEYIKDFRTVGHFYAYGEQYTLHDPTPIEEFRQAMGIKKNQYRHASGTNDMKRINDRVLEPIERELSPLFKDFNIEKIYRGRKVIALRFTWKPETKEIRNRISTTQRQLIQVNKEIQETFDNMDFAQQHGLDEVVAQEHEALQQAQIKKTAIEYEQKKKKGFFKKLFTE
jgi:plasmid replication initiation protein